MRLFTGVRQTALLASITSTFTFLWSAWSLIGRWPSLTGSTIPISLVLILIAGVTPVFYFALFRNPEPPVFPAGLRKLSLTAAIVFGVLVASDLPNWIESLRLYWIRASAFGWGGDPETFTQVLRLLGEASNLFYLLLLVAIFRAPGDEPAASSGFLELMSRVAVLLSGLWLVFSLVQTGSVPYLFWSHREEIERSGRDPHVLRYMLTGPLRNLLTAGCIFAAPYVVAMSQRGKGEPAV